MGHSDLKSSPHTPPVAYDIELCQMETTRVKELLDSDISLAINLEEDWRINPSGISRFFAFF
jgi:amino acid permease